MSVYIAEPREPDGRRQLVVAGAFLLFALVLNVLPPTPQRWISGTVRVTVLAPFLWTQQRLTQARMQAVQSTDLQVRLDSLTQRLLARESLAEENRRLRALLGLASRDVPPMVATSVVRPGSPGSEGIFTLDKGRGSGVKVEDPIIVADGIFGQVLQVDEDGAIGMDWTHPDFRISAMTDDGLTYGFVEPITGSFREDERMLFNGAPYSSELSRGDVIVASGRGGVFPRGTLVGVVDTIAEADAGWRKSYWIRPAVTPASVTHALVLLSGDDAVSGDVDPLELQIDSLLLELSVPTLDTSTRPNGGPPLPNR